MQKGVGTGGRVIVRDFLPPIPPKLKGKFPFPFPLYPFPFPLSVIHRGKSGFRKGEIGGNPIPKPGGNIRKERGKRFPPIF